MLEDKKKLPVSKSKGTPAEASTVTTLPHGYAPERNWTLGKGERGGGQRREEEEGRKRARNKEGGKER